MHSYRLRIASHLAVIALCKVITTGALNFKMAALHFFNIPQDVIIVTGENTSLKSTKDAKKFGVTLFKGEL